MFSQLLVLLLLLWTAKGQEGSGEGSGIEEDDPCPPILDVAFLLDTSGSIEEIYQEHVRWTVALSDELPIDKSAVRVTTIQYAGYPITEFPLNELNSSSEVIGRLKRITFQSGVTRTGYALRKADSELSREDRGARSSAKKLIVLFTDGLSIDDPLKTSDNLRSKGYKIMVVSVGSDGFIPEMQRIAGNKDDTYGPTELPRLRAALLKEVEASRVCSNGQKYIPLIDISENLAEAEIGNTVEDATTKFIRQTNALATANQTIPQRASSSKRPLSAEQVVAAKNIRISETTAKPSTTRHTTKRTRATAHTTTTPSTTTREKTIIVKKIRKVWKKKSTTSPTTTTAFSTTTATPQIAKKKRIMKIIKKPASTSTSTSTASPTTTRKTVSPFRRRPTSVDVEETSATEDVEETSLKTTRKLTPTASNQHSTIPRTTTSSITSIKPRTSTRTNTPKATTTLSVTTRKRNLSRLFAARNVEQGAIGGNNDLCSLDVLFIVDSSGSIISAYDKQKELLLSLIGNIDVSEKSHRVALLQFAGYKLQKTEWTFDKFTEKTQLMRAFGQVRHFTGTTYIGAALESAIHLLSSRRKEGETIVVLISDGYSQDNPIKPGREIANLSNVDFFVASLSRNSNTQILKDIAGDPDRVFIGDDTKILKEKLIQRLKCKDV